MTFWLDHCAHMCVREISQYRIIPYFHISLAKEFHIKKKNNKPWDFPGDPVNKTPSVGDLGLIPGQET